MLHISPNRLAALVDETASPDEATHLAACAACEHELTAHRRLVRMAATEVPREGPPLNDWASLGAMLKAEGLISAAPLPAAGWSKWSLAAAAAPTPSVAEAAAIRPRSS